MPRPRLSTKEFIEKAVSVWGNRYDYSLTEYIKAKVKIKIVCPIHGVFEQQPNNHLNGAQGCRQCYLDSITDNKDLFIEKAIKFHKDTYDYSLVNYVGSHTEVLIICPIHGRFSQLPYVHIQGHGCPECGKNVFKSKGYQQIVHYLSDRNINFTTEKKFPNLINDLTGRRLKLDIWLIDYEIAIEYDGEQHFRDTSIFNTDLDDLRRRDRVKDHWASDNKIKLIRISYKDYYANRISSILQNALDDGIVKPEYVQHPIGYF